MWLDNPLVYIMYKYFAIESFPQILLKIDNVEPYNNKWRGCHVLQVVIIIPYQFLT